MDGSFPTPKLEILGDIGLDLALVRATLVLLTDKRFVQSIRGSG